MKKLEVLLITVLVSLLACKSEKENYPTEVEIVDFSLQGTSCNWQNERLKQDSVYVIKSEDILSSYLTCQEENVPDIAFETYSLLVARGVSTSGIVRITEQLMQTAPKEYLLTVDVIQNAATVVQGWTIAVLAPQLPSDAIITLHTEYHN
jgi:hypothetical protein